MHKRVRNFIAKCLTCQTTKPFNRALQGLLQPLIILGKICDYISIDLITHLPLSHGKTTILVVVNLLSKYANFIALGSQFTAQQVATFFSERLFGSIGYHPTSYLRETPSSWAHFGGNCSNSMGLYSPCLAIIASNLTAKWKLLTVAYRTNSATMWPTNLINGTNIYH